jgi:hypothetical protein
MNDDLPLMPLRFDLVTRGDKQVPVWSRDDMLAAYDAGKRAALAVRGEPVATMTTNSAPQAPVKPPRRWAAYPLPLEDGFMAQVVLPLDLSAAEAQRLQHFIAALVAPWRTLQPKPLTLTDEQRRAITHELNQARCHEKRTVGNLELTERIARAVLAAAQKPTA